MSLIKEKVVVYEVLDREEDPNGKWWKQILIGEKENSKFDEKLAIQFWKEKCDQLESLNDGDLIEVWFGISSKEYNGKWFTNLNGFKVISSTGEGTEATKKKKGSAPKVESKEVDNSEVAVNNNDDFDFDDLPF